MGLSRRSRSASSTEYTPSERVVHAVAEREGTEPEALDPPLYSILDPEALDALCVSESGIDLQVSFTYLGHQITVDGDGSVVLEE